MENENKQSSELDSILKEISSFDAPKPAEESAATEAPVRKAPTKTDRGVPAEKKMLADWKANAAKKAEAKRAAEEAQAVAVQQAALQGESVQQAEAPAAKTAERTAPPAKTEKKAALPNREKKEKAPKQPKTPKAPKEPKPVRELPKVLVTVLLVISLVSVLWVGVNVHPDTGTSTSVSTAKNLNVVDKLSVSLNNAASDALGNLTYIKKIYTIAESELVCPEPNQANFGSTNDPAVIEAIIEQAADLLDGQEMSWSRDRAIWTDKPMQYYYDETILVITWKEVHNNSVYSFSEVKIAHGSQLRRALAGNEYGSSVEEYPTDMAAKANAVVGMNGDFYGFRSYGITVYQRQMYRHDTNNVETCFFTADGDMIFSRVGELSTKAEAEQFIADNNVVFSAAFGPILVENGEKVTLPSKYPIGEINASYSRAAIAQKDELHYILMTSNFEGAYQSGSQLSQTQNVIYGLDVQQAYTLDGGQTSTMFLNDKLVNRVDWNAERTMSDIIYFATALPEGGSAE